MEQSEQPVQSEEAFTPIHGITLDRYAELSAALARQGLVDDEQVDAWLVAMGVPQGAWAEVHEGWAIRMTTNSRVRNRFDVLYGRF